MTITGPRTGVSIQLLHQELNVVRQQMPQFAHDTDAEIVAVLQSHVHRGTPPNDAVLRPSVSGWATGALWFSRSDVAWWASCRPDAVAQTG
jgi:hypothetical protein